LAVIFKADNLRRTVAVTLVVGTVLFGINQLDGVIAMYEPRMRDVRRLLQKNPILQDRMIDVGIIAPEEAVAWSLTGPALRATGIAYDVRKAFPYSGYDRYEFDTPTRTEGDAYARFLVRLDEMDESMRIIRQVRKALAAPGPWQLTDTKFAPPPKETIALSMEALIHHFKLVSESFRVPPGDVYQAVEGPRGELGYYVVSNGDNRPWRQSRKIDSQLRLAGHAKARRVDQEPGIFQCGVARAPRVGRYPARPSLQVFGHAFGTGLRPVHQADLPDPRLD
jgi:NADH:ubiquinone oxidoreductase subunit D